MARLSALVLFGSVLALSLIHTSLGAEEFDLDAVNVEDIPDPPDMPCKAAVSLLTKRMLGGLTKCTKQLKFKNNKEKAAKMSCIMRCVAINEGFLQKDGYFGQVRFDKFVKKEVPPNLREKVKPIVMGCMDGHKITDQSDPFCKAYDPLIKCLMDKLPTFCT